MKNISGPSIILSNGEYFDFLEPEKCSFSLSVIAHALSNICRFGGHCPEFYSVAQHSVYVSQLVPPEHAFAGLMHDAGEAFVGDVCKPLKVLISEYSQIEERVEKALFKKFGLELSLHESVKEADVVMLATEQKQLFGNEDVWGFCGGRKSADLEIPYMAPHEAERFFVERYFELMGRASG